jgi:tetratricopeptide (TPR) repeat protein
MYFRIVNFVIFFFIFSFFVFANKNTVNNITEKSKGSCINCHSKQLKEWQTSDHAKAMGIADNNTVLADFNNKYVEHYGQKAHFFIKDKRHQVTITYGENVDTYLIKYTFGYFPLQQYLVETEKGKLQVLPFAWDSRKKSEGGQRWYHNYSHEEIRPEDRLHWRQPLQNWNGMCADCHSDGLIRNYDADKNSFNSQFDNINVGCLSCHGDMSQHADKASHEKTRDNATSIKNPIGQWLRAIGEKTARWQGEQRDNDFMDDCFACHSLRLPLTDGFKANKAFLDQFSPQLPSAPSYYADGQIKEEVYVYGSFLQSKMYDKGVNCIDCHDKHTMKLQIEGNGLCLQCHGGEVYNVKSHHQHEEISTGAQCVNCHMPTTRYMGVDDRRDHSFKVPRPDTSQMFGTPNACIKCHDDKSNQWANDNLSKWHGEPKALTRNKQFLLALNSGQAINLKDHLSIIVDTDISVILRASAIQQLAYTTQTITGAILTPYLMHKEALIRLSAASAATLLPPEDKINLLVPLLSDALKAIRIAAARSLLDSRVLVMNQAAFVRAFNELQQANDINSWRGEGRLNQGINALRSNDVTTAEKTFKATIDIDPYFESGYINLADLYRSLQKPAQVKSVLIQGMKNLPKSSAMKYSYGLHLVRQKSLAKAVTYFKKSMLLSPVNAGQEHMRLKSSRHYFFCIVTI